MAKRNATFLAPNKGLSITAGNQAYAYSGTFQASTSTAIMFDFQTPDHVVEGEFTLNGQVYYVSGSAGGHSVFKISFNGVVVGLYKTVTTDSGDMPVQCYQKVVIPPNTNVVVECISGENTSTELLTAVFSGKVHA